MADRTNINFSLTLEREPGEGDIETVNRIVGQFEPIELDLNATPHDDRTWTIAGFYLEGIACQADQIADALHEAFPDAEVRCWDDPKYEWLGTLTVYRRGENAALTASCDAYGTPVYTPSEILELVEKTKAAHEPDPTIALAAVIEAVRQLAI